MKPIFRDANGVLAYLDDELINDWDKFKNVMLDDVELYFDEELGTSCRSGMDKNSGIPVKSWVTVYDVSSKTNYERYFADLCCIDDVYHHICDGNTCNKCMAYKSFCSFDESLVEWLRQPAIDLNK